MVHPKFELDDIYPVYAKMGDMVGIHRIVKN